MKPSLALVTAPDSEPPPVSLRTPSLVRLPVVPRLKLLLPSMTTVPVGAMVDCAVRVRLVPLRTNSAPVLPPTVKLLAACVPETVTGPVMAAVMHAACDAVGGEPSDQFVPVLHEPPAALVKVSHVVAVAAAATPVPVLIVRPMKVAQTKIRAQSR